MKTILETRSCEKCGSNTSYQGKSGQQRWISKYASTDNYWCLKCYGKYILHPKWNHIFNEKYNGFYNERRLKYKGKTIYFPFDIHCGVCNLCRAIIDIDTAQTHRHHDENMYDDNNPLKFTMELCHECHGDETWKLSISKMDIERNTKGQFTKMKLKEERKEE